MSNVKFSYATRIDPQTGEASERLENAEFDRSKVVAWSPVHDCRFPDAHKSLNDYEWLMIVGDTDVFGVSKAELHGLHKFPVPLSY